jgi:precorrin-6B methylase 2
MALKSTPSAGVADIGAGTDNVAAHLAHMTPQGARVRGGSGTRHGQAPG